MNLLISFGTRAEWNKLKPLINSLYKEKFSIRLVFTGQQPDLISDEIFEEYDITEFDFPKTPPGIGNRLDNIIINTLHECSLSRDGIKDIFEGIDLVIVQGDTHSTFSMALAAFHRQIPIAHIEAGMRTENNFSPYPEEFNRRSISVMASYHFCPTETERCLLEDEYIDGEIYVTGNTGLDNIKDVQTSYGKNVIITMHRRENREIIGHWFDVFEQLSLDNPEYKFILYKHPSVDDNHYNKLENVECRDPIEHKEMIQEISNSISVITDSGGLQEESVFLGKKVFCCRDKRESERVEDLHSTFVENPDDLLKLFKQEKDCFERFHSLSCPYGDGQSSERIVNILKHIKEKDNG